MQRNYLRKTTGYVLEATFIIFLLGGANELGYSGGSLIKDITELHEIANDDSDDYSYFNDYDDKIDESFSIAVLSPVLIAIALVGIILKIFLFNVIEVGGKIFFIQNRSQTPTAGVIFDGFKNGRYMNIVKTMFLRDIQIFLWALLLIIPGVIKVYEYLMVPYILAENPTMDSKDVLSLSRKMMNGEKGEAFTLSVSFIGWILLSVFTCGLAGIFYVNPYYLATFTELYSCLKAKAYNEGYILQA